MSLPRYVVPHHGGLKYVRAIPKKLQSLEGRTVWTEYLGKILPADARTRAMELAAEHDRRARALRDLPETDKQFLKSKGGLARCQADAAQADYLAAVLYPYTLESRSTPKDRAEKTRRTVAAFLEAQAPVHNIAAKVEGKPTELPPRLFDLVALHERVNPPRSFKTGEKGRLHLARFAEMVGDLAPQAVTREHVIKFRDDLEAKGFKAANIGQHLAKLHTLFNVALSEGIVTSNPAHGVKARRQLGAKLTDGKQSFDATHVSRIFKTLDGESADFQWIVKLLAYHGARSTEICQLKCTDVAFLHGVPVLRIHDRHGSVKNKHSVRDIPIHPKCKGIIACAAKVAKAHGADAWLFQSLTSSKQGRGHNFQNYANRKFLRLKVGITDDRLTMHSFRHTWRTLARELAMPESVSRAILGHTLGGGEHGKYGAGPSLKARAKWIAKISPLKG